MILSLLLYILLAYVVSLLFAFLKGYLRYRRLKAQGIPFPWGYNPLRMKKDFDRAKEDQPNALELLPMLRKKIGDNLPPVIGVPAFADVWLLILDSSTSQQLFIDKNKFNTKHPMSKEAQSSFLERTLLFTETEDADYAQRRKIVTAAFFKQRLIDMTLIIKQVCHKKIQSLHANIKQGSTRINLIHTMEDMYADIIVSCSVGLVLASDTVQLENSEGKM